MEDRWREFHRPVRVGPLWIGPPWETAPGDALAVVIDPGRAFGTGAHPTTRLCLELLLDLPRTSLLDVGCGSGVLSIAAAQLGFGPVVGVDIEAPSIEATLANAEVNGVAVEARVVDALADPLPEAELVVANIALAAVTALGGRVRRRGSSRRAIWSPTVPSPRATSTASGASWTGGRPTCSSGSSRARRTTGSRLRANPGRPVAREVALSFARRSPLGESVASYVATFGRGDRVRRPEPSQLELLDTPVWTAMTSATGWFPALEITCR